MDEKKIFEILNDIEPEILDRVKLEDDDIPKDILGKAGKRTLKRARMEKCGMKERGGSRKWKRYLSVSTACACLIMMLIVSAKVVIPISSGGSQIKDTSNLSKTKDTLKLSAIAGPEFPVKTSYYTSNNENKESLDKNFLAGLREFSSRLSSEVLTTEQNSANHIFSPISLYMALAMTANGASSETQTEILNALSIGNFDMESINQQTKQLFQNLYFDNEVGHLKLANSLWLDQKVPFKEGLLQNLAKNYYAYSYNADFTDTEKTAKRINTWITENTGEKLGKTKDTQLKIDPGTIMAILNTIYYYDEWNESFQTGKTVKDQFHLADGTSAECDFMKATDDTLVIEENQYTAAARSFKNGGSMIFILPDQGVSPYDLIKNPQFITQTINGLASADTKRAEVTFKVPKFRYSNHFELSNVLEQMGIKRAFSPDAAEFTNLANLKPLFISTVEQIAYISIDEKGCEATAVSAVMPSFGAGNPPEKKINLTLDRPFLFILTQDGGYSGEGNVPLFVGVINNPTE